MCKGLGLDICEIARMEKLLQDDQLGFILNGGISASFFSDINGFYGSGPPRVQDPQLSDDDKFKLFAIVRPRKSYLLTGQ